jgi:hypothetical protein
MTWADATATLEWSQPTEGSDECPIRLACSLHGQHE